jgi:predicted HicB family RNase H-like nuclease
MTNPHKPASKRLNLRLSDRVHRAIRMAAADKAVSIQVEVERKLEEVYLKPKRATRIK